MTNNPPLATVDTEHGWTLFLGDDATAIYEFVSKYVDLPEPEDLGIAPPDETE